MSGVAGGADPRVLGSSISNPGVGAPGYNSMPPATPDIPAIWAEREPYV